MKTLVILILSLLSTSLSRGNNILENCETTATSASDLALTCHLRTINSEFDRTNLSGLPGDLVIALRLDCSDILFYQSTLDAKSLAHLPRLTSLHVEHCKLSRLPPDVFSNLYQLRNLTVRTHNTAWPALSLDIAPGVFDRLPRVEKIDLSSNNIWTFPENSFCSLTSLRELDVGKNRLQDLSALSFTESGSGGGGGRSSIKRPSTCHQSSGLERLDISHNRLILLPPGGLKKLSFLQELYLQSNEITIVASEAFSGLKSLRVLNLASNKIESLPTSVFSSEMSDLSEIYLQNNSLTSLTSGLFSHLNQLLVLDLSRNRLTSSRIQQDNGTFSGLIRLVNLNLSHNRLTSINDLLFGDLFSLQVLNLEENEIQVISGDSFKSLKNLHTLTLSHNKLSFIDSNTLNGLTVLTFLSLDNNLITELHPSAFQNNSNIRDINLNGNQFSRIPAAVQNLTFLKTLDLGENTISELSTRLIGLPNLYGLRLTGNQISNVSSTVFRELSSLKVVNLARNRIHEVSEGAFDSNRNLQAVRLDANYLTEIRGLFATLPNLLWLNVSDNQLTWFDYALIPSQLMWLDLHKNRINHLENIYGREEFRLQTLDASFNLLTTISPLVIPDSIENLYLNDNLLSLIEPNTFYRKSNLSRVDLFMNKLRTLEYSAVTLGLSPENLLQNDRPLPEFYMAGNPFVCDCRLEWIPKINKLSSVRDHPLIMDVDSLFCSLPYHQLGASTVPSQEIPSVFAQKFAAEEEEEAKPQVILPITDVTPEQFLCHYESHCFNLCHCCDFEACDCQMTCPRGCNCYHDSEWSINIVDCSANALSSIPASIPMDATELHLDGNELPLLSSHALIGRKNLKALYLNSTGLENIMNNSLAGLRRLEVLHLEDNYLREIRGYEFLALESLRELYLGQNQLQFIASDSFVQLKQLEVLDLSGNRLSRFSLWSLSWNPYLSSIALERNPWSCDCEFVAQALPWLQSNLKKFLQDSSQGEEEGEEEQEELLNGSPGSNLNCVHNGKAYPLLHMNGTFCSDSNLISTKSTVGQSGFLPPLTPHHGAGGSDEIFPLLPSMLAIGAVLLFVLTVFFAICRQRRCCWGEGGTINLCDLPGSSSNSPTGTTGSSCCWGLTGRGSPLDDDDKLFDAYIAYSVKDEAWVSQILATNLQQQSLTRAEQPYRLCLHYRDFVMTAYIADTIVEAVESSKRTVIVLSKNFLQSEWTSFEFKSALHTAIRNNGGSGNGSSSPGSPSSNSTPSGSNNNNRNRLVIVTLGDISTRDLDPDLRVMLRSAIVLSASDKLFWAKLKNALPSPRPVSHSTATWMRNHGGNHGSAGSTNGTIMGGGGKGGPPSSHYYDVNERNNWLTPGQFPQLLPSQHQQTLPQPQQVIMPGGPIPQHHHSLHHHHHHHQQQQQQQNHHHAQENSYEQCHNPGSGIISGGSGVGGPHHLQPILDNFHNLQCHQFMHGRGGGSESSEMDKTQYTYVESA